MRRALVGLLAEAEVEKTSRRVRRARLRAEKHNKLLERELSAATGQDSQFVQQLAGEIIAGLLSSLARLSTYRED